MIKGLLAISAFLFASPAFAAPNLTGQWTIHNNISGNENDQICDLAVAESKITGSCKSQDKDLPVTGTVDGNKVNWQLQSDYNGSPLTLIYTATLDGSNKFAGTVEVQPFGISGDFTATLASGAQSGQAVAGQSGTEQMSALTGQWTFHQNIAGNESDQPCKLVAAGNKITGSCKSQDKDLPVTGAVDGNKVTWQFQGEYNGSPITLIYTATLDTPGKMAGIVEVQPFGISGDFSATPASGAQSGQAAAGQSGPEQVSALTGQWTFHQNIAGNESDQPCKLVAAGNKITGSCKSQDKDLPVTGAVDGDKVTWQFQAEYNGSPITLIYTATLDNSGKIAGTVEVQPFGITGDFTATTSSASSQPGPAAAGQSGSASSQSGPTAVAQAASGDAAAEQPHVVRAAHGKRPKITGLSHLAVYTSNPEATDNFYRKVIGAVKLSDPENPQGVRYALSDVQFIEVLPLPTGAGINRLDHSAWNTENAEQLRRYLAANKWKTPDKVEKGSDGSRWFEVLDPEGNKVQFVQLPPHSKPLVAPDAIGHHIIHIGFLVHSREAEDKFYRTLLDFRPYWWGGRKNGQVDWVSQQTPDSTDWLEYMLVADPGPGIPANMGKGYLGVLDHFSIGETSVDDTVAKLKESGRLAAAGHSGGMPVTDRTQVGLDGKGQYNLFDPDGIRVEFMNFHHTTEPCCSPFTAPDPSE